MAHSFYPYILLYIVHRAKAILKILTLGHICQLFQGLLMVTHFVGLSEKERRLQHLPNSNSYVSYLLVLS